MNSDKKPSNKSGNRLHPINQPSKALDHQPNSRYLSQETLYDNQTYFARILEIANEAIISVNHTQRIILFNKGAERIFGYAQDEIINQPLGILLPEEVVERHSQYVGKFTQAPEATRLMAEREEVYGRRKNGQTFPANASISKLVQGKDIIYTVILRDITDYKEVEKAREELIAQLKALNEAARDITRDLSLDQVLQTIAEAARVLLKTKYSALALQNEQGHITNFLTSGISAEVQRAIGSVPTGRGLLGLLLHQGKSIIANHIPSHPAAQGFPKNHPPMERFLGVPVYANERLLGALYLADKVDRNQFTDTDQQLVEMLALHAANAIENARLYEQTQRLAVLEERDRFAQDLHDGIIQSIYGVGLALEQIKTDVAYINEDATGHIDLCLNSLADVIQDLRSYIFDLRPQAMTHKGLKARLVGLIQELRANIRLPVHAEIHPDIDAYLTDEQARHVFHICHEALSNAARHAKANQILVDLSKVEETIFLRVEDDGVGFERPLSINPGHRGLANIQTRVSRLGATLTIDTAPQQGTRLTMSFPCTDGLHEKNNQVSSSTQGSIGQPPES